MLMMTAESMLSKRPVLRFTVVLLFFLKVFSSHVYCIPIYLYKIANTMITDKAYAGAYLKAHWPIVPSPPPFFRLGLLVKKDKINGDK